MGQCRLELMLLIVGLMVLPAVAAKGGKQRGPAPNVGSAMELLAGQARGNIRPAKEELAQATEALGRALFTERMPANQMTRLRELCAGITPPVPSAKHSVKFSDGLPRMAAALRYLDQADLPVERVRPDPSAAFFPGSVAANAPRVREFPLQIDARVPAWHSTGLYAAAGDVITIQVPANSAPPRLRARIGAHTDNLWHRDWRRAPQICRVWPIKAGVNRIASPFGGPLYIEVPPSRAGGQHTLRVSGAVEAPLYVLGRTTTAQWRQSRLKAGPWAELAGKRVILTLPSDVVRTLNDPEAVMKYWDRVADACATLAGRPVERERPERFVTDMQVVAGYMHSGYPIMTPLGVAKTYLDLAKLRTFNAWGFYHELGHNHQSGDWTFGGSGEVTVNLFTMYVLEKAGGMTPAEVAGHSLGGKHDKAVRTYLRQPDFEKWKSSPGLALAMYAQLRLQFGWETYIKVIAEYRALPRNQKPRTDDQKRDQWMVRFSRAAGRNLGPFFEAWGVPTSAEARASIANLPVWMPETMKSKGLR